MLQDNNPMKIKTIETSSPEIVKQLADGVRSFNTNLIGYSDAKPLLTITKDKEGNLIGLFLMCTYM